MAVFFFFSSCLCSRLRQFKGAPGREEDKSLHKDKPMRWHCGFPNKVLWYTKTLKCLQSVHYRTLFWEFIALTCQISTLMRLEIYSLQDEVEFLWTNGSFQIKFLCFKPFSECLSVIAFDLIDHFYSTFWPFSCSVLNLYLMTVAVCHMETAVAPVRWLGGDKSER